MLSTAERPEAEPPTLLEIDPFAVAAEVIDASQASLRELRRVAARTGNASAKVGALRAIGPAGSALIDLLARLNLAPDLPIGWWVEREWERARAALLEVAEERGLDADELQDALTRRIEQTFTPGAELRVVGNTYRVDEVPAA